MAQGLFPPSDDPQPPIQLAELTSQLTSSRLERAQANQLVLLIQNLVQKPNFNQLSEAINLFNRIIKEATPEELASLRQNPAFVAISTTLGSTRKVLDS